MMQEIFDSIYGDLHNELLLIHDLYSFKKLIMISIRISASPMPSNISIKRLELSPHFVIPKNYSRFQGLLVEIIFHNFKEI